MAKKRTKRIKFKLIRRIVKFAIVGIVVFVALYAGLGFGLSGLGGGSGTGRNGIENPENTDSNSIWSDSVISETIDDIIIAETTNESTVVVTATAFSKTYSIKENLRTASATLKPTATPIVVVVEGVWIDAVGFRYNNEHATLDALLEKLESNVGKYEVVIHDDGGAFNNFKTLENALKERNIVFHEDE